MLTSNGGGEVSADPQERLDPDSLIIVLIGASAVGKSSIAERLCDSGVAEATPTWTTRPPRHGETDTAYDHHFVSDDEFDDQADGFIEQRSFYGARYGVPFPSVPSEGIVALMVLKPVFIPAFLEHYPAARVYQIEAARDLLPGRMEARGQSQADIEERMRLHDSETKSARQFAHVVFSNDGAIEQTQLQVEAQIHADRQLHIGGQTGVAAVPVG